MQVIYSYLKYIDQVSKDPKYVVFKGNTMEDVEKLDETLQTTGEFITTVREKFITWQGRRDDTITSLEEGADEFDRLKKADDREKAGGNSDFFNKLCSIGVNVVTGNICGGFKDAMGMMGVTNAEDTAIKAKFNTILMRIAENERKDKNSYGDLKAEIKRLEWEITELNGWLNFLTTSDKHGMSSTEDSALSLTTSDANMSEAWRDKARNMGEELREYEGICKKMADVCAREKAHRVIMETVRAQRKNKSRLCVIL